MHKIFEIYPDVLVELVTIAQAGVTIGRIDGPRGLRRVSSLDTVYGDPDGLNYTYWFDSTHTLGLGIDVYIVDTGINTEHVAFGGMAANLYPPGSNSTGDDNGHGTRIAGIAGVQYFGIAYEANLIGVQTLGADSPSQSNTP